MTNIVISHQCTPVYVFIFILLVDPRWHLLLAQDTGKENGRFERGIEAAVGIERIITEGLVMTDICTSALDSTVAVLSATATAPHLTVRSLSTEVLKLPCCVIDYICGNNLYKYIHLKNTLRIREMLCK